MNVQNNCDFFEATDCVSAEKPNNTNTQKHKIANPMTNKLALVKKTRRMAIAN